MISHILTNIILCIALNQPAATVNPEGHNQNLAGHTQPSIEEPVNDTLTLSDVYFSTYGIRDFITGLALLLSIISLVWNVYSKREEKKSSKNDDFWFRQVTYPIVVNPLLTFLYAQIDTLPSPIARNHKAQSYLDTFSKEIEQHRRSLSLLPIFLPENKNSKEIFKRLQDHFDNVEDCVANYCGSIIGGNQPEKLLMSDCINNIHEELSNILNLVKEWHTSF